MGTLQGPFYGYAERVKEGHGRGRAILKPPLRKRNGNAKPQAPNQEQVDPQLLAVLSILVRGISCTDCCYKQKNSKSSPTIVQRDQTEDAA